jgi:UMF1 family MFS transporter
LKASEASEPNEAKPKRAILINYAGRNTKTNLTLTTTMTVLANEPTINQEGNKGTTLNVDLAAPEDAGDNEKIGVTTESKTKKQCCNLYDGNMDAIGYSWLANGRGMMVMSNIFMLSSLLYLASDAAGCFEGESKFGDQACSTRIYGFYPSSLISNIGIISGLLAAFLMPVCGAMVDYTPYRRLIGIIIAIVLTAIQGIQVYTVAATWLAMLILQAIAAFFYQLQVVAVYAYLPEIAREVGESRMTTFCRNFTFFQFLSQFVFLVAIVVIQILVESSEILTAQISQGLNTASCIFFFGFGWFKYMTTRPTAHDLPEGHNLLLEGFRQNLRTARNAQRFFKKGLRWYYLALIFAESGRSQL